VVTIETFVKVYRKFTEWEWYDDINVSRVFLHLLITVNWTDKRWRGQVVKRGSITSSYEKLATETGLSVMQVRTAIKKLQSTGEITSKSSNKNTVFIVNNYDLYQGDNKQNNKQNNKPITIEQQTDNIQITTTKESKEGKKEKNNNIKRFTPPTYEQVSTYCKERSNTVDAERFYDFYESKGWMVGKNKMKDWKAAVRNWERSSKQETKPAKQNQFHNFDERNYDFDELEKRLFEQQMGG